MPLWLMKFLRPLVIMSGSTKLLTTLTKNSGLRRIAGTLASALPQQARESLTTSFFRLGINLTPPIIASSQQFPKTSLNTLLCHRDVWFYLLTIKSLFYFSKLSLGVQVIDDGSLTATDKKILSKHIKNISIISGDVATKKITALLKNYRYCSIFRESNHKGIYTHNKKLFDPILLAKTENIILIDSDIIFFNPPNQLINWVKKNNPEPIHMSYLEKHVDEDRFKYLESPDNIKWQIISMRLLAEKWPITKLFNSGIIGLPKKYFSLAKINTYLKEMHDLGLQTTWFVEQFAFAFLFSDLNDKLGNRISALNAEKYCVLPDQNLHPVYRNPSQNLFKRICIHYHSDNKFYLYQDGIKLMLKENFFRK